MRNDAQDKSDKKFKCELVNFFQPKATLGNEKTQALINVKDVQKASNRAKRIKYLDHQVKAAQVNVLDPKPRHSNRLKKVIAKAAVISSGNKLETNHDIPVPVLQGSKQSAVEIPPSQISKFQGNCTRFYIAKLCVPQSEITKHRCTSRD